MEAQRNDPCPCGSGQKYKNCCMFSKQAEDRMARSTRDVTAVVSQKTIPYIFWKKWNAARSRGQFGLLYDMTLESGAYRASIASREAFYLQGQNRKLPGGPGWTVAKIKVDETEAWVLAQFDAEERTPTPKVPLELMHLQRTADGWRLAEVQHQETGRDEAQRPIVQFSLFGMKSIEDEYLQRVAAGYVRADLADRPAPVEDEATPAAEGEPAESSASSASAAEDVSENAPEAPPAEA